MITNGGPHTPEQWAEMTTSQIIQPGRNEIGRRFELRLLEITEGAHRLVQNDERARLKAGGALDAPNDPTTAVDATLALIVEAAAETGFSAHIEAHRDYVRNVLGQHFSTSIQIERSWAADADQAA